MIVQWTQPPLLPILPVILLYNTIIVMQLLHRFSKGSSSSPVWLEDLACSYDYTRRTYNCTHDGLGITDCSHSKDVAISCLAGIDIMVATYRAKNTYIARDILT